MEVIEEENGVTKIDCAPFELAVEINSALVKYLFSVGLVSREKYENEIREPSLKVIELTKELLKDVPNEIKAQLPDVKLIMDEARLLHFLRLK